MANPSKTFTDYVSGNHHESPARYMLSPVGVFFREVVDIVDAFGHCLRHFPKRKGGEYTQASEHSLQQISAGCLCSVMGHFELYQKGAFSGLIEYSLHLNGFELQEAIRRLQKDSSFTIDPVALLAYRGDAAVAGRLIADNLPGWHDPQRVNQYFKSVRPKLNFYSNDDAVSLKVLWQLRHTMAHAGGWLSLPDAQKIPELARLKDKALYLNYRFLEAVVRRFHKILAESTIRLEKSFATDVSSEFRMDSRYADFFEISSPRMSWFPKQFQQPPILDLLCNGE